LFHIPVYVFDLFLLKVDFFAFNEFIAIVKYENKQALELWMCSSLLALLYFYTAKKQKSENTTENDFLQVYEGFYES
jgi:hypothetical protein